MGGVIAAKGTKDTKNILDRIYKINRIALSVWKT